MGGYSLSALLNDIKPYVLNWFAGMGGGTGPFAPTPHALGSTHHSGTLLDAQAPQFLLASGARALAGHLAVDAGITIDGVDLGVFAGRSVLAGAGLAGGGVLGSGDVTLNVGAGAGIAVAADTVAVDQAYAFAWTNSHTHAGHITPAATDTYDLGSSLKLWRKGWLAELDAVLFAQNVVTVVGGWLMVSKGEGTTGADIAPADTIINLGSTAAISINDFILFRAAGQVEYMQVTAGTGPTWTVTRNLDGSGANTWPAGSVFVNLGYNGTGRIELNANTTPRMSILRQGTAYNAQTEMVRVGDMNGAFGIASELYGFGAGDFAAGNYLKYETNGGFLLKAGAGAIVLDGTGLALDHNVTGSKVKWVHSGTTYGWLWAGLEMPGGVNYLELRNDIAPDGYATGGSVLNLTSSDINLYAGAGRLEVLTSGVFVTGGLNIGTLIGPVAGAVKATKYFHSLEALGADNPRFIFYDDATNNSGITYDASAITYWKMSNPALKWIDTTQGANRWVGGTEMMSLEGVGLRVGGVGTTRYKAFVHSLANNGVAQLLADYAAAFGLTYLQVSENAHAALVALGGGGAYATIIWSNGTWSNVAGTANSLNVYVSAGTYYIENKQGATRTVHLHHFGYG